MALDYTKAFDSVDFGFIFKTFETFGFGPKCQKWIKTLYNEGKSCISNNGNVSETFDIERSTRQGDPISPIVFILCLEILLINIRADENIKGIKIEKDEVKLSAYADDSTYFMNNMSSAELLLQKVELFSKVSGLEINRSKSECLVLDYEMNLSGYSEYILGIPVVENLKVLGHYHGKNERFCNFQNFYGKLPKMEMVLNIWKGRNLTLFGKNMLINALSNSLFLFNAQIETPPIEFIKAAEKLHKNFLWAGVPKIAHHTIIADYGNGGMRYKDLNDFIASLNLKFLYKLSRQNYASHSILPNYWIKNLFKVPLSMNKLPWELNVLDCLFRLPRKNQYKGHPFYYTALKEHEKLMDVGCQELESILSVPIWFNRYLKTKFDLEISQAGFNFVKDLYPGNKQIEKFGDLSGYKCRKLKSILDKMPLKWKNKIESSQNVFVTVHPLIRITYGGQDRILKDLKGYQLYNILISNKCRLPTGFLKWRDEFDLSDREIRFAFTFARSCTSLVSSHAFQYKILTKILPTKKYLAR